MSHYPAFPVPGVFFSFVPAIILAVFFFVLGLAFLILYAAHVAVVVPASVLEIFLLPLPFHSLLQPLFRFPHRQELRFPHD